MTLDPSLALRKDGTPVLYGRGKKGEDVAYEATGRKEVPDEGRPSKANLGNVTPSLKDDHGQPHHGGVTMAYALQTVVISLPALRRLRFPIDCRDQSATDPAARTVLAALGLCGAVLSIERGCDLRSRCLLVPEPGQAGWEIVGADGMPEPFALDGKAACSLLKEAVAAAVAAGLPWRTEPLVLKPSAGLVDLVKKSRDLAMQSGAEED
jgi:CRISPR-associated protein Csb1